MDDDDIAGPTGELDDLQIDSVEVGDMIHEA